MSEQTTLPIEQVQDRIAQRRVTVVGGARSGLAAARLLARHGADVFLTEHGSGEERLAEALREADVAHEFGGHTPRALNADLMVVSPGVPSTAPIVQQAERQKIPVASEIEVASWFCRGPIVAVTGSNGKTTTTSLIAHHFRTAGRKYVVAGNIGYPFSDYVEDVDEETAVVLEVSSFQLDHVDTFRPHVAVLLNITPDHLNRYGGDFNAYAQAKFRLFKNQRPTDWLVSNYDDELVRDYVQHWSAEHGLRPVPFSITRELERGAYVTRGHPDGTAAERIRLALPAPSSDGSMTPTTTITRDEDLMPTSDLALRGRHNLYNSLAAAVVARAMDIRSDVVRESLTSFEGVPHRLERVRTVGGVTFVNDSKATNVNAVWYALESYPGGVVLIAGGRDKGNDYSPLQRLVEEKVTGLVGLGESGDTVIEALGACADRTARAHTMEEAIQYAQLMAEPGDTVLLSPACASFDMYENYEERGDTFRRLVMSL